MRIAINKAKKSTSPDGKLMVSTNAVTGLFDKLSDHASNVWKSWGKAVEQAGGSCRGIIQGMYGVNIGDAGWWIPHFERNYIEIDDQYCIIDDVVETQKIIQLTGNAHNLWISSDTGLRLIRKSATTNQNSKSLSQLLGSERRFSSPSAWLNWSISNGTSMKMPEDQGRIFYFKGVSEDAVPRYHWWKVRKTGPYEGYGSAWWSENWNPRKSLNFALARKFGPSA